MADSQEQEATSSDKARINIDDAQPNEPAPFTKTTKPPRVRKMTEIISEYPRVRPDGAIEYVATKVGDIATVKLLTASKRFEEWLSQQPPPVNRKLRFIINGPGIHAEDVQEFIKWLLSFRMPFPSSYLGTKSITFSTTWKITKQASWYVLARWLDLKAPFCLITPERHLWTHIKDDSKSIPPGLVLSLWSIDPNTDAGLQHLALKRAVRSVAKEMVEGKFGAYAAFLKGIAENQMLQEAFEKKYASFQRGRAKKKAEASGEVQQMQDNGEGPV